MKKKAHAIIDKFADRGLRSLAVARQVSFYAAYFFDLRIVFKQSGDGR